MQEAAVSGGFSQSKEDVCTLDKPHRDRKNTMTSLVLGHTDFLFSEAIKHGLFGKVERKMEPDAMK